jgi:hypothetical protein
MGNQPDLRTLEGQLEFLDYHAPDEEARERHAAVNAAIKRLWIALAPVLPDGPGKTRTLHAVSHARMEANNCIANKGA